MWEHTLGLPKCVNIPDQKTKVRTSQPLAIIFSNLEVDTRWLYISQVAGLGRAYMFPTWRGMHSWLSIGRLEATHMINSFRVTPCLIGVDHNFLYSELKCDISNATNSSKPNHHTTIHFTHELSNIYSRHVQIHLSSLDSSLPLENLTTEVTHILNSATISSSHIRNTIIKVE